RPGGSGERAPGLAPDLLAALALPPLAAVAAAALAAHPGLRRASCAALALTLLSVAVGGLVRAGATWARPLHLVVGALALAAAVWCAVASLRGEPLPGGGFRDYVTLTKPRIMSLLLWTGAAGMFVGAR